MKRLFQFLCGLMAIALTACVNEKLPQGNPFAGEKITVTAYAAGDNTPSTRVDYNYTADDAPITLSWSEDDAFSVIRGGENQTFIKSTGTNNFTGTLPTAGSDTYYAVYPVVGANDYTKVPFDLSNQNDLPYLMYASSEDGRTYQFKHAVAYLKIKFPDELKGKTASITITTPIATDGTLNLSDGSLTSKTKCEINKKVTFDYVSTDVLFALPPMSENNKTLDFLITTTDKVYTYTLEGSDDVSIDAGSFYYATIEDPTEIGACYLPFGNLVKIKISANLGDATIINFVANVPEIPVGAVECAPDKGEKYYMYKDGNTLNVLTTAKVFVFNPVSSNMFNYLSTITEVRFNNCINTSLVEDIRQMFLGCEKLTTIDLSSFNTSNVTNMSSMFQSCKKIEEIDLGTFNTSSVTTMKQMFYSCHAVTSINLSSFNTSSVTNMEDMFRECKAIASIDLSNFNTSSVTTMKQMFFNCQAVTNINVGSFNTSAVANMQSMFQHCYVIEELDLSSFTFNETTTYSLMFKDFAKNTLPAGEAINVYVNSADDIAVLDGKTGISSSYAVLKVKGL